MMVMVIICWDISAIPNVITIVSDHWTVITLSVEYRHTKGEALDLAWNFEYSKLFTLECKNVNRSMTSLSMLGHKELIYFFFTRKRKNKISFYHSVQPRQVTPWSRCMLSQPHLPALLQPMENQIYCIIIDYLTESDISRSWEIDLWWEYPHQHRSYELIL